MKSAQGFRFGSAPVVSLRTALAAGLVLLVGVNAITLGLVAWNRSGEPEALLALSERELDRPYNWHARGPENSGLALRLHWRVAPGPERSPPPSADARAEPNPRGDDKDNDAPWYNDNVARWLDAAKLGRLGFVFDSETSRRRTVVRPVFLVMEYDGPAWQASVERARRWSAREAGLRDANPVRAEFSERARRAAEYLASEERESSRLFVIDAGLDARALRDQYPDRRRYAIVHGQIRASWCDSCREKNLSGWVERVGTDTVNLPHALRATLTSDRGVEGGRSPFSAEIAFGRRLEPWMRSLSLAKPGR